MKSETICHSECKELMKSIAKERKTMRRSDAFPKRWGHATFALAVATCAMLLALGAKAPAFGDESASAIQSEVETVNVQFSNVERPDGDYEKWAWPVKHDLYNIGDTGGPIM